MNRPDDERRERELEALDRLLEAQPDPVPPAGLAERVLAATAAERATLAAGRRRPLRLVGWAGTGLAAAAAVLLWFSWPNAEPEPAREPLDGPRRVASAPRPGPGDASEPAGALSAPPELLAELELLEDWELVVTDDLDLLLAGLDEADELLLELSDEEPPTEGEEQG